MDKKQLTSTEILSLAKQAFEKNELQYFLSGKGNYACPTNKTLPANIPTDNARLLSEGIYPLYLENKDSDILTEYKKAIIDLAHGDIVDVWLAFDLCWLQLYNEKRSKDFKSPFVLIDKEIIETVKKAVNDKKEHLKQCKDWQGWNQPEGLWTEITIQNSKLVKWFEVSLV